MSNNNEKENGQHWIYIPSEVLALRKRLTSEAFGRLIADIQDKQNAERELQKSKINSSAAE